MDERKLLPEEGRWNGDGDEVSGRRRRGIRVVELMVDANGIGDRDGREWRQMGLNQFADFGEEKCVRAEDLSFEVSFGSRIKQRGPFVKSMMQAEGHGKLTAHKRSSQ